MSIRNAIAKHAKPELCLLACSRYGKYAIRVFIELRAYADNGDSTKKRLDTALQINAYVRAHHPEKMYRKPLNSNARRA